MALEEELVTRLRTLCPRVFTPTAPFDTTRPYLTWQHIGGKPQRSYENEPLDIRNAFIQVNAWAATKKGAFDLIRAVEEALCDMPEGVKFTVTPMEEPSDAYIEGVEGNKPASDDFGALQTFEIWGER
jgi:hypothetical protein